MTTRYVDLDNPGTFNTRTGLNSSGQEWLGCAGLHHAAESVAAGDITYIKGTGDYTQLKYCPVTSKTGTFTPGESVTWDGGSSSGIVAEDSGLAVTIEEITGTLQSGDSLNGVSSGASANISSAPHYQSFNPITAGTSANMIKWIGVNGSWSVDGTFATLDGGGVAGSGGGVGGLIAPGPAANYQWYENIEVDDSIKDGYSSSGVDYTVFINVSCHDCGDDGFGTSGSIAQFFFFCKAYNNADHGFPRPGQYARMFFCVSYNNADAGWNITTAGSDVLLYHCIAHNNGTYGIAGLYAGGCVINSIADGNGSVGIQATGLGASLVCNRITNQSGTGDYGIDMDQWSMAAFNLFHNNTSNVDTGGGCYNIPFEEAITNILLSAGIDGSNKDSPDVGDGYSDRANDDFNLDGTSTYTGRAADAVGLGIGS